MDDFAQEVLSALIKLSKPRAHVRLNYKTGDNVVKYRALNLLGLYLMNNLSRPISEMWELAPGLVITKLSVSF